MSSKLPTLSMPLSILLVEKDPLTRQAVTYLLDRLKHMPLVVEDLASATGVLASLRVDLAILSLDLRDPDGGTVAARFKKLQGDLNVIVVGGRQPPPELTPWIDAWLQKPLSLAALAAAIEGAMSADESKVESATYMGQSA